ncbi:MAG: twin-arginine translocation signal domain-containing protein, partial [Myxococcales bacterium]|nr:twin-arginine translocation signal domain-containing protein [Myxococcales bacterium]
MKSRRDFVQHLAATTGAVVLAPFVKACGGASASGTAESTPAAPASTAEADPMSIPQTLPAGWDPIAFNRARGNAGAIPDSYRDDINGPDGETKHLGKHLPYFPAFEG